MKYPAKPTCHGNTGFGETTWRPADVVGAIDKDGSPRDRYFRTCSYCGSMHPEELVATITAQPDSIVVDSEVDWKYGWPHKFYIEGIPNPLVGQIQQRGSTSTWEGDVHTVTPIIGHAQATLVAKWYNAHLTDAGFDDEAWNALAAALLKHTGMEFTRDEKGLKYRRVAHQPRR